VDLGQQIESSILLKAKKILKISPERVISASLISELKRITTYGARFHGKEIFLIHGSEIHRSILEPHKPQEHKFTAIEQVNFDIIHDSAMDNNELTALLTGSIREQRVVGTINGLPAKGFLDIKKGNVGGDLKTTSAPSETFFIKKAREFGYFRQAVFYKKLANLDDFWFFGLQKKAPHDVFVIDCADHNEFMDEAEIELEYLTNIYKTILKL